MWNNRQLWHRFCRSADKEAKGSAILVWRLEAVPIKVERFVPRGTQTPGFRLNVGASDPLERGCRGKGTKKYRDSLGDC